MNRPTSEQIEQVKAGLALALAAGPFQISSSGAERLAAALQQPVAFCWWGDDDDDDPAEATYTVTSDGIAILPLHGPMLNTAPTYWMRWLGATSTPQLTRWAREALTDVRVKSVFLDVDSPGGHAQGAAALADALWALRQSGKRVIAGCRQVGSAAYHAASQASRLYAVPDGETGCIGTLLLLGDWSAYYAEMGVEKLRLTSTGAEIFKGAGAFGTAVTPEQRADFVRQCDELQALFTANVARGRGLTPEQANALADGRIWLGYVAQDMGLIDATAQPDAVLAALTRDRDIDRDGAEQPCPAPEPLPGATRPGEISPAATSGTGATMNEEEKSFLAKLRAFFTSGAGDEATPTPTADSLPPAYAAVLTNASITTPEQLTMRLAEAAEYRKGSMEAAHVAAVRAFGAEQGPTIAEGLEGLPIALIREKAAAWEQAADAALGTSPDKPAARISAPPARAAVPVDASAASGRAWDRLSADQQAVATSMGLTTKEQQDAFAGRLLEEKN